MAVSLTNRVLTVTVVRDGPGESRRELEQLLLNSQHSSVVHCEPCVVLSFDSDS